MSSERVQFWYEFASTYSYLSVSRIDRVAADAGVGVAWRPFLLGPIMKLQSGWLDSPFNIYPVKGRYMWRDVERLAEGYSIPFQRPSVFPRNGLLAARVACVGVSEGWCEEFTKRVFKANFADDRDISDPDLLVEILDTLGRDGEAAIARATTVENKDFLRKQTEEAKGLGIFGAPTFVVGREIFWGNDRLEMALEWWKNHRG